jgi:hypothetical protein
MLKSLLELLLAAIFKFIRIIFPDTDKSMELCTDKYLKLWYV